VQVKQGSLPTKNSLALKLEQLKQHGARGRGISKTGKARGWRSATKPGKQAKIQRRPETLQATHDLQAAPVKRQVWQEESERGGCVFPDDAMLD